MQIQDEILAALLEQRMLKEGYRQEAVYIADGERYIAPNGSIFYLFEAFGEDVDIEEAWDVHGNEISELLTVPISDGFPFATKMIAVKFAAPSAGHFIQAFVKPFQSQTPFIIFTDPVVSGDSVEGGAISVTDGEYSLAATFAYAWYFDGDLLPGETTNEIDPTSAGDYYCIVTATAFNQTIETQSNTVTITV